MVEAANSREALAYLTQHMPDVLVLDLLMPDIDGVWSAAPVAGGPTGDELAGAGGDWQGLGRPREKASLNRNLASLVSKQEASLDYFARIIGDVLDLRGGTYDTRPKQYGQIDLATGRTCVQRSDHFTPSTLVRAVYFAPLPPDASGTKAQDAQENALAPYCQVVSSAA